MKKIKLVLAVMLAALLTVTAVPFSVFATEAEPVPESQSRDGLVMEKNYNSKTGTLHLETFVTGEMQVTQKQVPVDVVLVLDVSGSMDDDINEDEPSYEITYDFHAGARYYYKDGNSYERAYYCEGDSDEGCAGGWFTSSHGGCNGHKGTQLTAKMSQDGTGTQLYVRLSRIEELKKSVNAFVDVISASSDTENPNRVAVVKYACSVNNEIGNTLDSDGDNYTQIVCDFTSDSSSVKNAVAGLESGGYTSSHNGLTLAANLIAADSADRQKAVILFTDGEPNGVNSGSGFETSAANKAIGLAKTLKDADVFVYTVGVIDDADSQTEKYLQYVSSNYPDAESMSAPHDKIEGGNFANYYITNGAELQNVFTTIAQEIGKPHYQLGSDAVMKDVISEYFEFVDDGSGISVHTETCTAVDADGNPTAWSDDGNGNRFTIISRSDDIITWGIKNNDSDTDYVLTVTLTLSTKTVDITGFDYSQFWVGNHSGIPGGKKVVLNIPIEKNDDACGTVPTNDDTSGIYEDGEPIDPFPVPETYVPYFTVVHSSDPENPVQVQMEDISVYDFTKEPYTEKTVTDKETEITYDIPYLYGGLFTDAEMTIPVTDDPTQFPIADGQTYYLKEVSSEYLHPGTLSIRKGGVLSTYMITAVDGDGYRQVGFSIDSENENIAKGSLADENFSSDTLYDTIISKMTNGWTYSYFVNGETVTDTANKTKRVAMFPNKGLVDDGIVCTPFTGLYNNAGAFAGGENELVFNMIPYYITLDGVKVSGIVDRKLTYFANSTIDKDTAVIISGVSHLDSYVMKDGKIISETSYVAPALQSVSKMTFAAGKDSFAMGSDVAQDVVCITRNTDDIEKPLVGYAGDLTGSVTPEVKEGSLFAGWYTDEQKTQTADFSDVQSDMTVYAKYREDFYLKVRTLNLNSAGIGGLVLLTSTVTGAKETGFIITVNGEETVVRANTVSGVGGLLSSLLFGTPFAPSGALAMARYNAEIPTDATVTVLPYWVTADGTTVYGTVSQLRP